MKTSLLFLLFSLSYLFSFSQATGDYRSNAATMNWTNTASWQRFNGTNWVSNPSQGYPGQNTGTLAVTIQAGHTVTLDVSPAQTIGNLTINTNTSALTVSGNRTLNVSGSWTNNGGSFSAGTGTVNFSGNAVVSINGTSTSHIFNNLTITKGTGSVSVAGSATTLSVNGNFLHTSGTYNTGTAIITNIAGNFTRNGGSFNPGTGTITMNGITQLIGGSQTSNFHNLIISNNTNTSLAGNLTISQNLLVSSGTFRIGNDNTNRTLTVNGNIQIVSGATINTTGDGGNVVNIGGQIQNEGTLDFAIGAGTADLTFNGAANQTISGAGGLTDFNRITINNTGAANNNIVEVNTSSFSAAVGFLTLTRGIFKLSGAFSFANTFFNTATPTINDDEGFWLNNANATVTAQAGSTTLAGLLRVSAGTYNIGTAADQNLVLNTNAAFTLEGGAVNIAGVFNAANAITYQQSGGNLTVCTIGNTNALLSSFNISNAGASFTMSGGNIILQRPAALLHYNNLAGTFSVTGGTTQFGNPSTPAGSVFSLGSTVPFYNLTVSATNNPRLLLGNIGGGSTSVLNDVTIGGTMEAGNIIMFLFNQNLSVGGNWINNGTFTRGAATVTFNSTTAAQTIGGSSTTTFHNLTHTNTTAGGLSLLRDANVANVLSLNAGSNGKLFLGSNNLTINSGGSISGANSTRYIVSATTSATNGRLRQNNLAASVARLYPIGNNTEYLPATITPTAAGSDFSISVFRGTSIDGLPGGSPFDPKTNQVDAVWRIDRAVGTANAAIRLDWYLNALEGSSFTTLPNGQIAMWRRDLAVSPFWRVAGTGFTNDNVANYSINTTVTDFGTAGTGYPYIVSNINVLPGKLIYFVGKKTSSSNELKWEYENTSILKSITIERATVNNNYVQIAELVPRPSQEFFQYSDVKGRDLSKAYYRLKFTETDGAVSFSHTILIAGKESVNPVLLQNPAITNLPVLIPNTAEYKISVIDLCGKIHHQSIVKTQTGQVLQLPIHSLLSGYYLLRLESTLLNTSIPFIKQ